VSEPERLPAEHDPDPRVLDELLRAFADQEADDTNRTRSDALADVSVDELLADAAGERDDDAGKGGAVDDARAGGVRADRNGAGGRNDGGQDGGRKGGDAQPSPTVITITDDDLPDAVYLSGDPIARVAADLAERTAADSAGVDANATTVGKVRPAVSVVRPSDDKPDDADDRAGDDRAVVFIDDDDTGDTVTAAAGRSRLTDEGRGMEPRLRDRRIAVRRAAGRRRLRWFVVVGAIVVVIVGALALLGSPLFSVEADQVRVTGAVYTNPDRLHQVIDDLVGTPTLTVDTQAAEEALEAIPWVDEARVRTHFPRGVSIEIRERRPLATYQGPDGQFRVIDRDGRVLDVLHGQPIAYMLITGPDPMNLAEGEYAPVGYASAAELVRNLTPGVRGRVSSISATADGSDLRLLLVDGPEIRFGAANDLLTKLVRLETVLTTVAGQPVSVIDVSTPEVTIR
jgi:cell division septal protein FtsQ